MILNKIGHGPLPQTMKKQMSKINKQIVYCAVKW